MSRYAMEWAKRQQPGDAESKLLLLLMADEASGSDLRCRVHEQSLATSSGLPMLSVTHALDRLEAAGLISARTPNALNVALDARLLIPDKWWTPTTGRPRGNQAPSDVPTAVYRFYDDLGALLYIGISDKPEVRFGQHERTKPWCLDVRTREIVWYDSKPAAEAEEERAIYAEAPIHNRRDSAASSYAPETAARRKRRRRYVVANGRFRAFTKLVEAIRADVFEGEFGRGLLPGVDDLTERYGAGVPEVQRALEVLHGLGVLDLVDDGKYIHSRGWSEW